MSTLQNTVPTFQRTPAAPQEPEMKLSELKDGTIVEVIPKSEFWTSVVIVLIAFTGIPYLTYCLFTFYERIDKSKLTSDDKSNYENLWIGSIIFTVLLSISIIIFIAFYFKNYTKRAFSQDKVSIRSAFQKISRELAQHAADEYSDQKVDEHIEDMRTLGGRIMASQGYGNEEDTGKWYNDPEDFKRNYRVKAYGPNNTRIYEPVPKKEPEERPSNTPPPTTVQETTEEPPVNRVPPRVKAKMDAPYVPW